MVTLNLTLLCLTVAQSEQMCGVTSRLLGLDRSSGATHLQGDFECVYEGVGEAR